MNIGRWRGAHALIAACAALCTPLTFAHEFKLEALINTFVKVDGNQAHVVVRAPLYLFKSVKFPVRNGEIDLPQAATAIEGAGAAIAGDIVLHEDGRPLTPKTVRSRLSLPSDKSFESYDEAVRHVAAPVDSDERIVIDQGYVDTHMTYPIASPHAVFSLRSNAARELGDYLKVSVRYEPYEGSARALIMTSESGTVDLNPTWYGAASGFVVLGMVHILGGFDHLLFLLCLVIPLRGWRQVLAIVTVFTVAHSFTLIGAAFGLSPSGAWFPPFVETMIAASIVYMALENIMGADIGRRILVTGLFGLVHGFGFSYGLQESLQFAGSHLVVSLFAFNLGIELGQLLALAVMMPLLFLVRRYVLRGRVGMIILSALVAQTAWSWMLERGEALWKQPWPRPDLADLATAAFWIAGVMAAGLAIGHVTRRLALRAPGIARPREGFAD
jgi:hypothetical protein